MEKVSLTQEDFKELINLLDIAEEAAKNYKKVGDFEGLLDSVLPDEIKNLDLACTMNRNLRSWSKVSNTINGLT